MTTTFRRDIVSGATSMMAAFIAANPGIVARHFRVKPEAPKDLPCTYLDLTSQESIAHSNGVRVRTASPSIVLLSPLTEAGETDDRHEQAVDYLVDHFTNYPHMAGGGTVWDQMTVADEYDAPFMATRFTFVDVSDGVGRN